MARLAMTGDKEIRKKLDSPCRIERNRRGLLDPKPGMIRRFLAETFSGFVLRLIEQTAPQAEGRHFAKGPVLFIQKISGNQLADKYKFAQWFLGARWYAWFGLRIAAEFTIDWDRGLQQRVF